MGKMEKRKHTLFGCAIATEDERNSTISRPAEINKRILVISERLHLIVVLDLDVSFGLFVLSGLDGEGHGVRGSYNGIDGLSGVIFVLLPSDGLFVGMTSWDEGWEVPVLCFLISKILSILRFDSLD